MARGGVALGPNQLDVLFAHLEAGGLLFYQTARSIGYFDAFTHAAGYWTIKAEGNGYRITTGKKSLYYIPGLLRLSHARLV